MDPDGSYDSFEEMVREIAQEVGRSVQRAAEHVDVEELAGTVGVDPDQAREWVDTAAGWLRSRAENLGDEVASRTRESGSQHGPQSAASHHEDALRGAEAHPLDLPTEEQGLALAALDSGRWTVEPGSETLASHGDGPGPADALGLVRELRVRDWIGSDGQLTLVGRHALSRWLDAASPI